MSSTESLGGFGDRERSLEDGYFRVHDATLVSKLQSVFQTKVDKEQLRKISGVANEQVIDRLINLQVNGEMLTAFKLFPLVQMAWADGQCDKKEAHAVLEGAVKLGIVRDSNIYKRLEDWVHTGPTDEGRAVWFMYAAELCKSLAPDELKTFREDLLKQARNVADASGGVLDIFLNTSPEEKRVIEAVTKALTKA